MIELIKMKNDENWINKLLEPSGIKINGENPWDIKVLNDKVYSRIKTQGSLGLGETYMDGWWECEKLDEFFCRLFLAKIPENIGLSLPMVFSVVAAKLFNLQAKNRAFEVGKKHYDLDNKLFAAMLGKTMAYSCGYWRKSKNLDDAQVAKFDLICKKLNLKKNMRILDIGCGWGSFAKYAAENYGVSVVGITVSKEQAEFAQKMCKGLPVEIRAQDYRELDGKFDRIVSVGMFEHVGRKNYKTYFEIAKKYLNPGGLFLLHTIGRLTPGVATDPWLGKYIFPNGSLPSLQQIAIAVEKKFVIEDVHNFGADYDKTLMAWHKNFINSWARYKTKYDERFFRMWNYYLLSCAGGFRAREIQLWQIVLSPDCRPGRHNGITGGYKSIR